MCGSKILIREEGVPQFLATGNSRAKLNVTIRQNHDFADFRPKMKRYLTQNI